MIISVVCTVLHGPTVHRTPRGVALDFEPKHLAYYNNTEGYTPTRFACQSPPSKSAYGPPPNGIKTITVAALKVLYKKGIGILKCFNFKVVTSVKMMIISHKRVQICLEVLNNVYRPNK